MAATSSRLTIPASLRRGALKADEEASVESGARVVELLARRLELTSLQESDVLDVGCGTKVAQAILNKGLPVRRYVGLDLFKEMIDYLRANVTDLRFEFHHVDFHNEMYNPAGRKMTQDTALPVGNRTFDVICLFSVFTHLAPDDFHTMLCILRRYVKADGRLLFTLFIDQEQTVGFRDAYPGKPLLWAYYSEEHACELIRGTGWEPTGLYPPEQNAQYQFVCRPV
jgi:SAM-dependent methyltransferase